MTALFDSIGHLTDEAFKLLMNEELDELSRLEVSEHLSFCNECLEQYTALLCDDCLMAPSEPVYPAVSQKLRRKNRVIFLRKLTSVSVAACMALVFWSTGFFSPKPILQDMKPAGFLFNISDRMASEVSDWSDSFGESLNRVFDFSNVSMMRGVFHHE